MQTMTIAEVVADRERVGKGTATVERLAMAGKDGFEIVGKEGVQRVIAAPLDRMWKAGDITKREYDAGDEYRTMRYLAKVDPAAPTVDWNAVGGSFGTRVPSMFSSQRIAEERIRWRAFSRQVRGVVATVAELALIRELAFEEIGRSVFGRDKRRDAAVAGHTAVRMMLGALADQMGL